MTRKKKASVRGPGIEQGRRHTGDRARRSTNEGEAEVYTGEGDLEQVGTKDGRTVIERGGIGMGPLCNRKDFKTIVRSGNTRKPTWVRNSTSEKSGGWGWGCRLHKTFWGGGWDR